MREREKGPQWKHEFGELWTHHAKESEPGIHSKQRMCRANKGCGGGRRGGGPAAVDSSVSDWWASSLLPILLQRYFEITFKDPTMSRNLCWDALVLSFDDSPAFRRHIPRTQSWRPLWNACLPDCRESGANCGQGHGLPLIHTGSHELPRALKLTS